VSSRIFLTETYFFQKSIFIFWYLPHFLEFGEENKLALKFNFTFSFTFFTRFEMQHIFLQKAGLLRKNLYLIVSAFTPTILHEIGCYGLD
jgi:hypothetical protein